ncbi:Uma2 family endonuclease [Streptomyces triticagri]|uniref:Uma2 family endonuclease n=1 Tax=Streptomyces triticagri TaxID=2293568 RepID=A0A372LYW5_9ACTN|nr:Uma2 family endonuclease [Streptomyces triticagri]RFU83453.1 Uma2 family endonuclease [Streptomyces triticagri]
MTVLEDRIDMAEIADRQALDAMFEALEHEPFLEGYKIEIVEGAVHMTPQRDVHWEITRKLIHSLEDRFGRDVKVKSDVRIDFPGYRNGLCPDVAKLRDHAEQDAEGRWRYQDIDFIGEVISRGTAANDYGPKLAAYATAGVPVYLIADPYEGLVHVYTRPDDTEYHVETKVVFGQKVDLTHTPLDLVIDTDKFPRDRK